MMSALSTTLGIYAGTLVVCFLMGLVPILNTELFLIGVVLVAQNLGLAIVLGLLAAFGEVMAKVVLYYTARGAVDLGSARHRGRLEKARARIEQWKEKPLAVTFVSAVVGLPPFYLVSSLAGALKLRLRSFILVGFTGRALRFVCIAMAPLLFT
jgi:membrane protein YqaA with SNARE-associated domain